MSTPDYLALWQSAKLNPTRAEVIRAAHLVNQGRARYEAISKQMGGTVPWVVIGALHYREADCDFAKHLYNGDDLRHPTHNEPRHQPSLHWVSPPGKLEDAYVAALKYDGMDHADWSHIPSGLAKIEAYNGVGYEHHGINSPYLWSGTNHYTAGKYVADGVFSTKERDHQAGVVAIFLALGADSLWPHPSA